MKSEKQESLKNKNFDKTLVIVGIIVGLIIAIVVISLVTIANPFERRRQRIDGMIKNDFDAIKYEILAYYRTEKTVPTTLDTQTLNLSDDTKARMLSWHYKYTKLNDKKYELCATFQTDSKDAEDNDYRYGYYGQPIEHQKGYDCIEFEVKDMPNDQYPEILPVQ